MKRKKTGVKIFGFFLILGLFVALFFVVKASLLYIDPDFSFSFLSKYYDIDSIQAREVVDAFQKEGLPIGNIIEYQAENDPNGLLGKEHEYTQKVDFEDTLIEHKDNQIGLVGGTIEIFADIHDANIRYTYLDTIIHSSNSNDYLFLYNHILVRLDGAMTQEHAHQYESVLIRLKSKELQR